MPDIISVVTFMDSTCYMDKFGLKLSIARPKCFDFQWLDRLMKIIRMVRDKQTLALIIMKTQFCFEMEYINISIF